MSGLFTILIVLAILAAGGVFLWKKGYLPKKVHDDVEEAVDKVDDEFDKFKDAVEERLDEFKDKLDKLSN